MVCRCRADICNDAGIGGHHPTLFAMGCCREANMADVAKLIEEHLQHQCSHTTGEPSFANCLTMADKFEAHGMGVVIEELMSHAEMIEYQRD
jgi:precorrin isomerase